MDVPKAAPKKENCITLVILSTCFSRKNFWRRCSFTVQKFQVKKYRKKTDETRIMGIHVTSTGACLKGRTHHSGRCRTSSVASHAVLPLASYSANLLARPTIIGAIAATSSATVKSPVMGLPTSDTLTSGPAPVACGSVCQGGWRRANNQLFLNSFPRQRNANINNTTATWRTERATQPQQRMTPPTNANQPDTNNALTEI